LRIVAQQTLAALWCVVPEEVAGVAFPSDGQSPARATANLAAVRRLGTPWPVTFSFGRALTDPALAAWHGDPACVAAGQHALANRVACNVAALQGSYASALEPSYVLAWLSGAPLRWTRHQELHAGSAAGMLTSNSTPTSSFSLSAPKKPT
jgi:hypothetical protein